MPGKKPIFFLTSHAISRGRKFKQKNPRKEKDFLLLHNLRKSHTFQSTWVLLPSTLVCQCRHDVFIGLLLTHKKAPKRPTLEGPYVYTPGINLSAYVEKLWSQGKKLLQSAARSNHKLRRRSTRVWPASSSSTARNPRTSEVGERRRSFSGPGK